MYRTGALVNEVGENAACHRLVTYHEYVLVPLKLHNDWLKARNQVLIGLQCQTHCVMAIFLFGVCVCVPVCTVLVCSLLVSNALYSTNVQVCTECMHIRVCTVCTYVCVCVNKRTVWRNLIFESTRMHVL